MRKLLFQKHLLGTGGSRLGLSTNDKISVENLLYGLMMVSGNDAAVALAEFISGDIETFSNLMNEKAHSLHLESTHFTSPHGLDQDEHYTTAYDLALIGRYAMQNEKFRELVSTQIYTLPATNKYDKNDRVFKNTNELIIKDDSDRVDNYYYEYATGIKTGYTRQAGYCLASQATREGITLTLVLLNSKSFKSRFVESAFILDYGFRVMQAYRRNSKC